MSNYIDCSLVVNLFSCIDKLKWQYIFENFPFVAAGIVISAGAIRLLLDLR